MAIYKSKIVVTNEINKSGELVMKENRTETKYLFGVPVFERIYLRDTEQSELNLDEGLNNIGFKSK